MAASGFDSLPENSLIVVEEETGAIKSVYAQSMASRAAAAGTPVTYLTMQTHDEVVQQMARLRLPVSDAIQIREIHDTEPENALDLILSVNPPGLVVFDSFSTCFLEYPTEKFRPAVSRLATAARKGVTILLLNDTGVLPERHEQLLRAMADGVVRITVVMEGDKIKRYLNILKMKGTLPPDKMLLFTITEEGFLIDTRERHG